MKQWLCLILAMVLTLTLAPAVHAEEDPNEFAQITAQFAPTGRISPERSVVRTDITFQNVAQERSCALRWYIGDVLCKEERNFLLRSGAVAEFECSVHFDNETGSESVLWVEIVAEDDALTRAVFSHRLLTKSIQAAPNPDGSDYIIHVLRNQCVVIVYERNDAGEPGRIVNVFACSPGLYEWTITGRYTATSREKWLGLMDGVSGHYATLIWGDWLFHSVPYYGPENHRLKTEEYNKLGQKASAGCIRMAVSDAKWIYDNCLSGTTVRLYDSDTLPVEMPVPIRIDPNSPHAGWDPTDPHPDNPTRAIAVPGIPGAAESLPAVSGGGVFPCSIS